MNLLLVYGRMLGMQMEMNIGQRKPAPFLPVHSKINMQPKKKLPTTDAAATVGDVPSVGMPWLLWKLWTT